MALVRTLTVGLLMLGIFASLGGCVRQSAGTITVAKREFRKTEIAAKVVEQVKELGTPIVPVNLRPALAVAGDTSKTTPQSAPVAVALATGSDPDTSSNGQTGRPEAAGGRDSKAHRPTLGRGGHGRVEVREGGRQGRDCV